MLLLFSPGRLEGESRPGENNKSKKLPWNSLYDWYRKRGQVIRAQLSSYELLLLFYNCHSSLGKKKFSPLIVKYALLENMSQDNLAGRQLKLPVDDKSLYPPCAYGES